MQNIIEPGVELPYEILLDWYADQGYDELRFIDQAALCISGNFNQFDNIYIDLGYRDLERGCAEYDGTDGLGTIIYESGIISGQGNFLETPWDRQRSY